MPSQNARTIVITVWYPIVGTIISWCATATAVRSRILNQIHNRLAVVIYTLKWMASLCRCLDCVQRTVTPIFNSYNKVGCFLNHKFNNDSVRCLHHFKCCVSHFMLRVGWSETNVRMQAIEEENRQLRQTVERLSKMEDILKTEPWLDERSETTCSGPEQRSAVSPCNQILLHHTCYLYY